MTGSVNSVDLTYLNNNEKNYFNRFNPILDKILRLFFTVLNFFYIVQKVIDEIEEVIDFSE